MPSGGSAIPEITDGDIEWIQAAMRLEPFDEYRRQFLKCRSTVDVAACPGSGKTTLVVAKLAILARKWPHRTRGICVLSHTNVAREQIQHRLADFMVGQRLLSYPHFVDTIHGFVNRFLALPWLRSNGFPSPIIDDDLTTAVRCAQLTVHQRRGLETYLSPKRKEIGNLRVCGRDLSFDLGGTPFGAGPSTPSYQNAKLAVEGAAKAGFFCYDEMFVWAKALLEDIPEIRSWMSMRFPLVIVDEMQDTFNRQGSLLHDLFPRDSDETVVQRVGDPNQEIFDFNDPASDPTDPFPDVADELYLEIPNSYRFGAEIANLASPIAVVPVGDAGLCGLGLTPTSERPETPEHAIFIFPDDDTSGVLDAYGRHVLKVLDRELLTDGLVTAVGAVHDDRPEITPGHNHYPKTVSHYWSGYTPESAKRDPHPKTLVQYVRVARADARSNGNLSPGIEKLASGITRLGRQIGGIERLGNKARTHRSVTEALASDESALATYQSLTRAFLIDGIPLTEKTWFAHQNDFIEVAKALCDGAVDPGKADSFLAWSDERASSSTGEEGHTSPNIYQVSEGGVIVNIRLGSIHSVKGQTHLATMVLSTYWNGHSSKKLLPWLIGSRANGKNVGINDRKRLLQHYVAMTRPSHLLCVAIPQFALADEGAYEENVNALKKNGWRVAEVVDGEAQWRD